MSEAVYDTGLYKAVEAAGGVSALARQLRISRQALYVWLKRGYTPPIRAIELEELYGIPRSELMDPVLMRGSLAEATSANAKVPYRPRGN